MNTSFAERRSESGMALILVLIFTVLLYALIAELVTTARTARMTGENDALMTQMQRQMLYTRLQVEEQLLEDLAAAAAGEEGGEEGGMPGGIPGGLAGGAEGGGGLPGGLGGEGGEEEEAEPDPAALADCSQDTWFEPSSRSDGEITVYHFVEDENRKFNLLTLVSPDEEFARLSRERLVRLIDYLRQDFNQYDLSSADAEAITEQILQWMSRRSDTQSIPRPELKSDVDERAEVSLPLHLDELLLLTDIDDDLFFDKVLDSMVIPGLESVLTVYTSMQFDPGEPEDIAAQERREAERGVEGAEGEAGEEPGEPPGGGEPAAAGEEEAMPEPEGYGVLININTAPRPVLRALFTVSEIPDSVIDAIIRYRNEEMEEDESSESGADESYSQYVFEGETTAKKVFTELDLLDEIPEFQNLPDPSIRDQFMALLTTQSDVFSIHLAALYKRNEENRVFVITRQRSVFMRIDDGGEGELRPIILNEERRGLRVMPVDLREDEMDQSTRFQEMDLFSQEERAWNPFFVDFYRPKDERDQLFNYTDYR